MPGTTSTIASLAAAVSNRLQDPNNIFWNQQFEVYAALAEAVNELLLILGRPTQIVNQPVAIQPNVVWQTMPAGMLAITDIRTNFARLNKTTLRSLDYVLGSWSSSWESDRAVYPQRWAPVGLSMFVVHPAPLQPIFATVTGIAYPFTDTWPPTGAEQTGFQQNLDQALEMYATAYCRVKEIGNDHLEGQQLYRSFLDIARRATTIEDRKDSLVFTMGVGAPTAITQTTKR